MVTVIGSAIAGSILYGLGAGLAEPISNKLGIESAVESYRTTFEKRGAVLIFLGGLTLVPSYLVNLVAGATGYPFFSFITMFSASRFVRFGVLGVLLYFFGDTILKLWARQPQWLKSLAIVMLTLGTAVWSLSVVT